MRKPLQDVARHAGIDQRLPDPLDALASIGANIVDDQPLLDDLADRHARVESGEHVGKIVLEVKR